LALDSGDYGSAQRIAHSLKSVSLTLGAESLSKLAQSVEKRIREVKIDAELSAEIVSMTEAFKLVCSEIAAMQIDINAPALIDVDPQFFHALVAKFELQLDNQDSHAIETWRTLEPLLEEAVGVDVVEQLAQQMQRPLDLLAAQATLRKIVLDSPGIKS
jgi:HPt (histidine-containing phosphotransfer) domain-containing protein